MYMCTVLDNICESLFSKSLQQLYLFVLPVLNNQVVDFTEGMMESTCIPLAKPETGLPSFNQVRLGAGIPLASHSNLTRLLTTTATMLLLPKIDGGTEKE